MLWSHGDVHLREKWARGWGGASGQTRGGHSAKACPRRAEGLEAMRAGSAILVEQFSTRIALPAGLFDTAALPQAPASSAAARRSSLMRSVAPAQRREPLSRPSHCCAPRLCCAAPSPSVCTTSPSAAGAAIRREPTCSQRRRRVYKKNTPRKWAIIYTNCRSIVYYLAQLELVRCYFGAIRAPLTQGSWIASMYAWQRSCSKKPHVKSSFRSHMAPSRIRVIPVAAGGARNSHERVKAR